MIENDIYSDTHSWFSYMWKITASISLPPTAWRRCMDRYKVSAYIWYSFFFLIRMLNL